MRNIVLTFVILLPITLWAQKVSNVVAQQKGDKIEVSYTLDKEADTYLNVVINGKYKLCKSVSGDIGENISAGRHTAIWDVLADMDEFIGDAYFEVHASKSSKTVQAETAAYLREQKRAKRMEGIYPLGGFDVNGGFYGIGGSIYWPWVTGRPSRVGSYVSYVCGLADWKDSNISMFHNICAGATITLSPHVAWFFGPGLSIVQSESETAQIDDSYYYYGYDSDYKSTYNYKETQYKFAVETGFGFRFLAILMASVKISYPLYLGVGLGFEIGSL